MLAPSLLSMDINLGDTAVLTSSSKFILLTIFVVLLLLQAFSKVVQKLVPQLPTLENLLNILITVSIGQNGLLFYLAYLFVPLDLSLFKGLIFVFFFRIRVLRKPFFLMWSAKYMLLQTGMYSVHVYFKKKHKSDGVQVQKSWLLCVLFKLK